MSKYMDIIPPKRSKEYSPKWIDRGEEYRKIIEEREKENRQPMPYPFGKAFDTDEGFPNDSKDCLHKNCPNCHGSGSGAYGACLHMISCPCPSCSPTMLVNYNNLGEKLCDQNKTAMLV